MEADTPPGRREGKAVESDATPMPGPGGDSDELDATASLPTDSDILVCYPTFPGKGQPSAVTRGVPPPVPLMGATSAFMTTFQL